MFFWERGDMICLHFPFCKVKGYQGKFRMEDGKRRLSADIPALETIKDYSIQDTVSHRQPLLVCLNRDMAEKSFDHINNDPGASAGRVLWLQFWWFLKCIFRKIIVLLLFEKYLHKNVKKQCQVLPRARKECAYDRNNNNTQSCIKTG